MNKVEKNHVSDKLVTLLEENNNIYITDASELDAEAASSLRRACFNKQVDMRVVKNTLLNKAIEKSSKDFGDIPSILKGNTAVMVAEVANGPAKLIKEFRKKSERPILKAAYVEESVYMGDNMLDTLVSLKSKDELIADVIGLLQSPMQTVMSQLESGKSTLAGLVKTLSEKES